MADTCTHMQSKVTFIYLQVMLRMLIPYSGYVNKRLLISTQNNKYLFLQIFVKVPEVSTNVIDQLKVISSSYEYSVDSTCCLKLIFVNVAEVSPILIDQSVVISSISPSRQCLMHKSCNLAVSKTKTPVLFSFHFVWILFISSIFSHRCCQGLQFLFRYLQCSFAVGRFISIFVSVFLVPDKMLFVNLVSQVVPFSCHNGPSSPSQIRVLFPPLYTMRRQLPMW